MKKVIEPLYESKAPLEICKGLATRLGVSIYSEKTEDEWLNRLYLIMYIKNSKSRFLTTAEQQVKDEPVVETVFLLG